MEVRNKGEVTYLSSRGGFFWGGGGHRFEGSEVFGTCSAANRSTIMIVSKGGAGVTDL